MEEISDNMQAGEGSGNLFSKFGELPGGVQRVIIAILVVLVLVAVVFIQRLVKTEEAVSEEMDVMETVESMGEGDLG